MDLPTCLPWPTYPFHEVGCAPAPAAMRVEDVPTTTWCALACPGSTYAALAHPPASCRCPPARTQLRACLYVPAPCCCCPTYPRVPPSYVPGSRTCRSCLHHHLPTQPFPAPAYLQISSSSLDLLYLTLPPPAHLPSSSTCRCCPPAALPPGSRLPLCPAPDGLAAAGRAAATPVPPATAHVPTWMSSFHESS